MWFTAATLHFKENAAKWCQAYKQNHTVASWKALCSVVESKFGLDDYRTAMNELLALKQTGSLEDYTITFQSLQYDINMHNPNYDDMFFTPQYISGLKDEIRSSVEPRTPTTVDKAALIANIQQGVLESSKSKYQRNQQPPMQQPRVDNRPQGNNPQFWRDRQLRDYRKANGLCSIVVRFEPCHIEVCSKRPKAQAHALIINDLDREIPEEVLNHLETEDNLNEEFGQLSLNAIFGTDHTNCIKLKARVKDKVMLVLVDSGSSHSFVSAQFFQMAQLPTVPVTPRRVKLANGQSIVTDKKVLALQWYCQGHTLTTKMVVLDMNPYDAILGFDWLQKHSLMQCDWINKTLEFTNHGRLIQLKGLHQQPLQLTSISATKVYNSTKGNGIWAFVLVDYIPDSLQLISNTSDQQNPAIQQLLDTSQDVFSDPQTMPPHRAL